MTYTLDRAHAEKSRITRELFIHTADDNYIAARWCFVEAPNVDFFWLAVHALEKYMKAVLLLNGKSAKSFKDAAGKTQRYGHDIEALYTQVHLLAPNLLPATLSKPDDIDIAHWHVETTEQFIARLHRNGNADNRYLIFGFTQMMDDLIKLDRMVYAIRRLCRPMDAYFLAKERNGTNNPSNRDILASNPDYWRVAADLPLEKVVAAKGREGLQPIVLNMNIPFAPKDYEHKGLPGRTSARNPVLHRALLDPLQSTHLTPEQRATVSDLRDWVLDNIQLPPEVKQQIRDAKPHQGP